MAIVGGTKTTDGLYTVHKFTSSGTLACNSLMVPAASVLIVGGGGGGCSGGGGGGGVVTSDAVELRGDMAVVVGDGGQGVIIWDGDVGHVGTAWNGENGEDSTFGGLTAEGGGGGGMLTVNGSPGGSGGGGGSKTGGGTTGAAGSQGYAGGDGAAGASLPAGGGGGAGGLGADATEHVAGDGGTGVLSSITGTQLGYAGGGGGALYGAYGGDVFGHAVVGYGGSNGGWEATRNNTLAPGTANTGGGGGGNGGQTGGVLGVGANGGSGIVVVRYLTSSVQDEYVLASAGIGISISPAVSIGSALHWTSYILINNNDESTDDNDVIVTCYCVRSDGETADEMRFSEDLVTWSDWEAYATTKNYQLSPQTTYPTQQKILYADFRTTS